MQSQRGEHLQNNRANELRTRRQESKRARAQDKGGEQRQSNHATERKSERTKDNSANAFAVVCALARDRGVQGENKHAGIAHVAPKKPEKVARQIRLGTGSVGRGAQGQ